jgi:predicted nucleic acid-binding protein
MIDIFIDINVLVHAHDKRHPKKWARAREVIKQFEDPAFNAHISTQVLQEFYHILTRKLLVPAADAKQELERLLALPAVIITPPMIVKAAELHGLASISLWDALVVTAAQTANCSELWSEDMQDGQRFGALTIINPFRGLGDD